MNTASTGMSAQVVGDVNPPADDWFSEIEAASDDGGWDEEEITLVFHGPSSGPPAPAETAAITAPAGEPHLSRIGLGLVAALSLAMTLAAAFAGG